MGISRSTLYNELNRGTVEQINSELKTYQAYFWDAGQRTYEENRRNSRPPLKIMKAYEFVCYAEKQILENKLSPDAICGEAKLTGKFSKTVCTKTLYNYIDLCLLKVKNIDLLLIENWINKLPRKIINYHCSDFIFRSVLFDIAI